MYVENIIYDLIHLLSLSIDICRLTEKAFPPRILSSIGEKQILFSRKLEEISATLILSFHIELDIRRT